jgi:AcrR family transcriptional regulator
MPKISDAHEQQQREKILHAAATCFRDRGYHETSVQDICDAAKLSKGGLYTYFQSKDEILAAVIDESFIDTLRAAQAAASDGGTAVDKLDRVAAVLVERLVSEEAHPVHSPQLHLEIWAEASKNAHLRALCAQAYDRWKTFLAGLLREGMRQGLIRPDIDPEGIAATLVAVFDGLSLQESIARTHVHWPTVMATLRLALGEGIFTPAAGNARTAAKSGGRQ